MRTALLALLLLLFGCQHQPIRNSMPTDAVELTVLWLSGGPAPLARQVSLLRSNILIGNTRSTHLYHIHLSTMQAKNIRSIVNSEDFKRALNQQKEKGDGAWCCDREMISLSLEQPPTVHSIKNPTSFARDSFLPTAVSDLLDQLNSIISDNGFRPLFEEW